MPPMDDFDFVAVVHSRQRGPAKDGWLGERRDSIQTRQRARSALDARGLSSDLPADKTEDLGLELQDPFFSSQDFAFPFLKGRDGEALSVNQRLPSFVIGGHARGIGLRNLNEVT